MLYDNYRKSYYYCEVHMELDVAASLLKELGHPTRLSIYRQLVKAGEEGLAVGHVQKELNIPASTLSHHISAMVAVGLIKQRRQGRTLYCTTQYVILQELLDFMTDQCCAGDHTSINSSLPKPQEGQNFWKQHSQNSW